jgi:arabinose-5-phosphate isomerase
MSVIISELKFTKSDFSRLHPSGSIGRKLNLAMRDLVHKAKYNNISVTSSFSDILLKLSASTIGSLTVLDVNDKVVGVITDGDIRRLLVNATLHELDLINAKEIMNKKPILVMNEELSYDVLKMMRQKGISFVPVVEKDSSFKYSIGIADLVEEGFDD